MRRLRFGLLTAGVIALLAGCGNPLGKLKTTTPTETTQKIDDRNTNKPAESTLGQVYRAGKRAGLLQEMQAIGDTVNATVILENRMPSAAEIKADLQRTAAKYATLIEDGTIVLTDTRNQTGLWAYEVDADKAGGIVIVGGKASRMTADEVKTLLAAK